MAERELFHQLICDPVKRKLQSHYGDKLKVELDEPQCPRCCVTIFNIPESSVVIKMDRFGAHENFFKGSRGECKLPDYVIISEYKNRITICYIEMKSGTGNSDEIIQKFKGGQCLLAYCGSIIKLFWMYPGVLREYEERFISICRISSRKKLKTKKASVSHNKPENMLKITGSCQLQFKELAGG